MRAVADGGDRPLAVALAAELRKSRSDLVARWLDRISSRVTFDENRIFPTEQLLNRVPLLIDGTVPYLEHPEELIDSKVPVAAKAMELGALRHSQGFDAYEILKEYEILGAILDSFLSEQIDRHDGLGTRREVALQRC